MNFARKLFWTIKLYGLMQKKVEISCEEARKTLDEFLPNRCLPPSFSQVVEYNPQVDVMIVVPVYNVAPFLEQCIQSILNQKTSFSYIAVFVDDGSTDGSSDILDKYEGQKSIAIIHQENHGYSGARNAGLRKILGDYICFLDSDDFMAENAVEIMMSAARKNDADIVEGSHYLYGPNGECKLVAHSEMYGNTAKENLFGYPWGKVIRSSFFRDLCFPDGYLFEDTIMGSILYPECERIVTLSDPIWFYRQNSSGITQTVGEKRETVDTFWLTKYCMEEADRRGVLDSSRDCRRFYNKLRLNYLRLRSMPVEIKQSVFVLSCELYQQYFEQTGEYVEGKYKWLKKCLSECSYAAYEYLMQRWTCL
ncbi:MAG: glycosyltransferase family 2 protein [Lachnospiraceae bacterium]|nr:glycosyltransferase family 2 protein [Lachnospiraceae bacterium]